MDDLTKGEEDVMRATFKAAMLRAAVMIDAITQEDVEDAQLALFKSGVPVGHLCKVDRALLASCHLRSCAQLGGDAPDSERGKAVLMDLKGKTNG